MSAETIIGKIMLVTEKLIPILIEGDKAIPVSE